MSFRPNRLTVVPMRELQVTKSILISLMKTTSAQPMHDDIPLQPHLSLKQKSKIYTCSVEKNPINVLFLQYYLDIHKGVTELSVKCSNITFA